MDTHGTYMYIWTDPTNTTLTLIQYNKQNRHIQCTCTLYINIVNRHYKDYTVGLKILVATSIWQIDGLE